MKDIPAFLTSHGAASLTLREIPYTRRAYILLRSTQEPEALLGECAAFCRECGAEQIFAAGHPALEQYPLSTGMVVMRRQLKGLPETDALLFPVLPEMAERWRQIYNRRMAQIPNAAFLSRGDMDAAVKRGDGYFVHRDGALLGIGKASGCVIDAVIAEKPGAGRDVLLALTGVLTEDFAELTVATANIRAVRLYESLGFLTVRELDPWYRIL